MQKKKKKEERAAERGSNNTELKTKQIMKRKPSVFQHCQHDYPSLSDYRHTVQYILSLPAVGFILRPRHNSQGSERVENSMEFSSIQFTYSHCRSVETFPSFRIPEPDFQGESFLFLKSILAYRIRAYGEVMGEPLLGLKRGLCAATYNKGKLKCPLNNSEPPDNSNPL